MIVVIYNYYVPYRFREIYIHKRRNHINIIILHIIKDIGK